MKVLLVAYALSPSRGSEAATAWGWTTGLAAVHDVTVVSRTNEREEVIRYLEDNPGNQFTPVWVEQPNYSGPMAAHINYIIWLRRAQLACETLVKHSQFNIVHHVSYGSIHTATKLWKLKVPYVLGPLGGGQFLNPMFEGILGRMPMSERLRNLRVSLLPHRPAVRKMIRRATIVLVTNEETGKVVERCGGSIVKFCDSGVQQKILVDSPKNRLRNGALRMLWIGRMLFRKGVPLIFKAMKIADSENLVLDLVGAGPMEDRWRKMAEQSGLSNRIRFHGRVPFSEVFRYYDSSDLFVFPSVNDAFGGQLLEACARGLPLLVLNHQGAGALVPDAAAWKVPVESPDQIVNEMATAMIELSNSPERLAEMSHAAVEYAKTEIWLRRVQRLSALYKGSVVAGSQ